MKTVNMDDLLTIWKKEYEAPFSGWDFSYLKDRWIDEEPPWDYREMAQQLLNKSEAVLDMGTGGGELLASLAPLPEYTVATESREPNIAVARERLEPLGVKVIAITEENETPFDDEEFDAVINRHESYQPSEIFRILKAGGTFLTQQVGGNNLVDLAEEFNTTLRFEKYTYDYQKREILDSGLILVKSGEWRGIMEFRDVGSIAYFIKAVPWQVPDFDIDRDMHYLEKLQQKLENGERLVYTQVRHLFQATKPK